MLPHEAEAGDGHRARLSPVPGESAARRTVRLGGAGASAAPGRPQRSPGSGARGRRGDTARGKRRSAAPSTAGKRTRDENKTPVTLRGRTSLLQAGESLCAPPRRERCCGRRVPPRRGRDRGDNGPGAARVSGRPSAGAAVATKCRRVLLKYSRASALYPQQCREGSGRKDRGVLMGWSRGHGMKFNRMESEVVCLGREETFHCKASASARPRWCQLAERTAGSCQQDTAVRRANMNHALSDPWERREPGLGTNVCVSSHPCSGEISLGWNCPFGDGE